MSRNYSLRLPEVKAQVWFCCFIQQAQKRQEAEQLFEDCLMVKSGEKLGL